MEQTIAAISTSTMSSGGISIVRLSGIDAVDIADKVFTAKNNKKLRDVKSHTIHYGLIKDGDEVIDEVLVSVMRAPNTYTREDVIEINCHGGILVTKKVLDTVIKHGARPAEPGEFTKRAFLNGRIDLSQAEAVIDIINARNDYALKSSVGQLGGKLSEKIKKIREIILDNVAFIESALDDPEHYDINDNVDKMCKDVDNCVESVDKLLKTADNGRIMRDGIRTVILGKTNAGKSSLLNALAREERAIVTDIEGTTRDVLEEQINLSGVTLNLIDTAGIRKTDDYVENIGVNKAKQYAADADLIIYVIDSSRPLDNNDYEIMDLIMNKKVLVLLNKSDMEQVVTKDDVLKHLSCNVISGVNKAKQYAADADLIIYVIDSSRPLDNNDYEIMDLIMNKKVLVLLNKSDMEQVVTKDDVLKHLSCNVISVSAKEETGIDSLESEIKDMFFNGDISTNEEIYITNLRHKNLLREAYDSLKLVKEGIDNQMSEDFLTIDLMNAYEKLGLIIGEEVEDDLADRIFEKFCMGK